MAESNIKTEDIVQKGLYKEPIKRTEEFIAINRDLIKSFDEVIAKNDEIVKSFKDISKQKPTPDLKALEEQNKLLDENIERNKAAVEFRKQQNKVETELTKNLKEKQKLTAKEFKQLQAQLKLEKEQAKGKQKLKKFTDEEIKAKIKNQKLNKKQKKDLETQIILEEQLGVEIKDKTSLIKNLTKIEDLEITSKEQAIAQNKALRDVVNGLNPSLEDEAIIIERLNAKLDSNTQFLKDNSDKLLTNKINIGGYAEGIKEAAEETGVFGGSIGLIIGKIKNLGKEFVTNIKESVSFTKTLDANGKVTKKLDVNFKALGKTLKAVSVAGFVLLATTALNAFKSSRKGAAEFEEKMKQLTAVVTITGRILIQQFERWGAQIGQQFDGIKLNFLKLEKVLTFDDDEELKLERQIKDLEKVIKDQDKTIAETEGIWDNYGETIKEAVKEIDASTDAHLKHEEATALANKQIAILTAQEAVLATQAGASTNSFEEQEEALLKLLDVTEERIEKQRELALAEQDFAVKAAQNALIGTEFQGAFKDGQIASLEILKNSTAAGLLTQEAFDGIAESAVKVLEIEGELKAFQAQSNVERIEIARDRFEKELDFAIDIVDVVKTSNERRIADDRATLDTRLKLFLETRTLVESAFKNEISLLEDFRQERLSILKASGEKEQSEVLERLDLESLVLEKNEEAVRARLRGQQLDDVTLTRILEIIKERKTFVQDLIDLEREIAEIKLEADLEELERKRTIQGLENDIANAKLERTIEQIDRENDLFLENETKRAEELFTINLQGVENRLNSEFLLRKLTLEKQLREEIATKSEAINEESNLRKEAIKEEMTQLEELGLLSVDEKNAFNDQLIKIENKRLNDLKIAKLEEEKLTEETNAKIVELERLKNIEIAAEQKRLRQVQLLAEKKLAKDSLDIIEGALDRRHDKVNKELEEEVEARGEAVDEQARRAEQGQTNQLAFEKEQRAKAEQEQIEAARRQAQAERFIRLMNIYLASFEARVKEDPDTAAVKAVRDTALAEAVSLTYGGSAYDGVDDTGGRGTVDSKGGKMWTLHPNEQVWSKDDRSEVGNRTREEIKDIVKLHDSTSFNDIAFRTPLVNRDMEQMSRNIMLANRQPDYRNELVQLKGAMGEVVKAVENKPVPSWDHDKFGNVIEKITRGNITEKTTYHRRNKIG